MRYKKKNSKSLKSLLAPYGHRKVKWFEGDIAPTSVELITADESNVVDDDENGTVFFL